MMNNEADMGFTIIEMIVTVVVVSVFMIMFGQSYLVMESQRVLVARQATASDIAASNLRKFTTRPVGLTCDASMESGGAGKLLGDQSNTTVSSAYGFIAEPASATQSLGTNPTQEVRAFTTGTCSTFASKPVKIVSKVRYGANEVVHVSFVD